MAWRRRRNSQQTKPVRLLQVVAWQHRKDALQQSIDLQPDGEWAWLWQTRIKVLSYLLDRHETAESRRVATEVLKDQKRPSPSRTSAKPNESTAPYDQPPIENSGFKHEIPVDHDKQQQRLTSLHKINEVRRASEPPIEVPKPPPVNAYQQSDYTFQYRPIDHALDTPESSFTVLLNRIRDLLPSWLVKLMLTEINLLHLFWDTRESKGPPDLSSLGIRHREPPHSVDHQSELNELADLLARMDQESYEAWRRVIAFDLGMAELTDDVIDEEAIRALLSDHGLPKPPNDIDSADEKP